MKRLTVAEQERLIGWANMASNVFFNLAQDASIKQAYRTTMNEMREDWDALRAQLRETK